MNGIDWLKKYQAKIREASPQTPFEELVKIIWEDGILARLAPTDEAAREYRRKKEYDLWDRDDPAFYWRLLYSARYSFEADKRCFTSVGWSTYVGFSVAVAYSLRRIALDYQYFKTLEAIERRAEKELSQRFGLVPHHIPWGAVGSVEVEGVPVSVTVVSYTPDGAIGLNAFDFDGHKALYSIMPLGRIEPSELDPANFKEHGASLAQKNEP